MGSPDASVAKNDQASLAQLETVTTADSSPAPALIAAQEDSTGLRDHWKCLAACTMISMCPFQYGIDFSTIGGLQAMTGFLEVFGYEIPATTPGAPPTWNIETHRQQLISSLMVLGAFASSLLAGPMATHMSRRMSVWVAIVLCCVANVLMMTANAIGQLYVGRLLIGLANGMLMTFSQLYIQECSPAKYRGMMISGFQVWTSVGTLVGTIINNFTAPLSGRRCYLIPLGIVFIVPGLLFFGLFLVPESPRWLMDQGRPEQARRALRWLRPYADAVVDKEANEIEEALEAEKANAGVGWGDLFRDPVDRRRTMIAVAAVAMQGASGSMYMIMYGTYFFQQAHISNAFQNTCILSAVGVAVILINSAIITRWGRRRVMLTVGMTICGFAQLFSAIVYTVNPGTVGTGRGVVAFAVIYIVGYNGLVSSYAWLSGGEMPSQRLRSLTFGLAASVGFLLAWLASFTAPYFINGEALNWGPKYGYLWFPSCLIAAVWIFFFMPEVKGRTLEEIDEMFMAKLPARKFRQYQCVGHLARGVAGKTAPEDASESAGKMA